MTRPITDLVAALVADRAITLDERGLPQLPNEGWAKIYMTVGWNMSGDYNTFQMQHDGIEVDEEDRKDLAIIAKQVGYSAYIEYATITFRPYNAYDWENRA